MAALACGALLAAALASSASAKTIHVRAKKDDAIEKGINRANAGDRIVVHRGTYDDPFAVDKSVRIVGRKRGKKPVLAFSCGVHTGVDVTADGVALRRLKLRGAYHFTLDISLVSSGTARQLRLIDACDAEYGINVSYAGAIQVLRNRPSGYTDAGIYVGSITDTGSGTLLVDGNEGFANNRGLIVEDVIPPARIRVAHNRFHDNTLPGLGDPSGIFVHNSDGGTYTDNVATDNGAYGIDLDPGSDNNRLFDNLFSGNGSANVRNQGSGNCGSGNSPNPFPAC